ncbi:MAG: hypothetical protein AB7H97_07310 [Pseudobdellovibrionaceae bacterium]
MKRFTLMLFATAILATFAIGQQSKSPTFGAYPAKVERKTAKAIDFRRSPGASTFRTRLREAIKGDVNFAGRYILTGWGCGTGCSYSAIIDARTGRVYFPDELLGVSVWFGSMSDDFPETYTYRKNSRLLVIRGTPGPMKDGDSAQKQGTYYYEWRANRLRLIKFIPDSSRSDG